MRNFKKLIKSLLFLTILAFTSIVYACGPKLPELPTKNMPANASFEGLWYTDFGDLKLSKQDSRIYGNFEHKTGGKIDGNLKGAILLFQWVQEGDFNVGRRQVDGHGYFIMSDDGLSFKGEWGYGENYTGGGKWDGRKATEIY